MTSMKKSDFEIAYHEAGHALACVELDVMVDVISIIEDVDRGTAGHTGGEGSEVFFIPEGTDPFSAENDAAYQEWVFQQAVINYAGHAAVVAILGIGDMSQECADAAGAGDDYQKSAEVLGNNLLRMEEAKSAALRFVISKRHSTEVVASALQKHGTLFFEDFHLLLASVPEEL